MIDQKTKSEIDFVIRILTGQFLKEIRERAGFSFEDACNLLYFIEREKLEQFEAGDIALPLDELHEILKAYGFPPETSLELHQRAFEQVRALREIRARDQT